MNFAEIKSRLSRLDTACICDADKSIRTLSPEIRPLNFGGKLIGKAHTVSCKDDFLTVIKALHEAAEDEILVIDGQGGQRALAGELFSTEAERRGLAGMIIDGACRDVKTVKTLRMPVYARHLNPMAGGTKTLCQTQITIQCGGVQVEPGDIVFGDEDGVLVVSEEEISRLIPIAEQLQEKEEKILERMNQGASLLDMLNFEDHCRKLRNNENSNLQFTYIG